MDTINQRRISDVSFVIDDELNVSEGNRSFLRLFNITDPHLNLASYMTDTDSKNFKFFLKTFRQESDAEKEISNPYFIATIILNKQNPKNAQIQHKSCLFFVEFSELKNAFNVEVVELSYSKCLLDSALLESREYKALLQNFDADYFIFDGTNFKLKNTKDVTVSFQGGKEEFKTYFANNFDLNMLMDDSNQQFNAMIADCEKMLAGKIYKFLQNDKKLVTVHTVKTSTRNNATIIGSITSGEERGLIQNIYSEKKDGLTDLYNKKAITEIAIRKVNEQKNPVSMIIMDVDKFKECNDTYGHAFGDKVLTVVSTAIKEAIAGIGIAGRIGGDEFLIMLDKTSEEDIRNVTRNIRIGIQWSITAENPESVVTCSMGIARAPQNATNYEELFKIADKCLYIAKAKGRSCYIIYKPELHESIVMEDCRNSNAQTPSEYYMENANEEIDILMKLNGLLGSEKTYDGEICDILGKLCTHINVHRISVFTRKNQAGRLMQAYSVISKSAEENMKQKETFLDVRKEHLMSLDSGDQSYFKYFQNGMLHMDNTNVLNTLDKTLYKMYIKANVASTLEFYDGNILICCDIFKPARTFKKDKIVFATLASKILQSIL